jgi:hypothetical protein
MVILEFLVESQALACLFSRHRKYCKYDACSLYSIGNNFWVINSRCKLDGSVVIATYLVEPYVCVLNYIGSSPRVRLRSSGIVRTVYWGGLFVLRDFHRLLHLHVSWGFMETVILFMYYSSPSIFINCNTRMFREALMNSFVFLMYYGSP